MSWKMFIDDERFPVDEDMVVVRSFDEAIEKINENGCPVCIYFDHDIGEGEFTGYDLAKWLIEKDLDSNHSFMPENFHFEVHSQNPVGRENINGLLNPYLVYRNKERLKSSVGSEKVKII